MTVNPYLAGASILASLDKPGFSRGGINNVGDRFGLNDQAITDIVNNAYQASVFQSDYYQPPQHSLSDNTNVIIIGVITALVSAMAVKWLT